MAVKAGLPVSSCWIATEALKGLQNQAIGLAQALGVSYVVKEMKKTNLVRKLFPSGDHGLKPPWPDVLITCGRQSVPVSMAVRDASKNHTFTVHIQDPLTEPDSFDVVILPEHDKLRGENVFVTQGALTLVTEEKLAAAAEQFKPLFKGLPQPLISVLVGGKNRHQSFSVASVRDFAEKLRMAAANTGGALAVTASRRTGEKNEAVLRQELTGVPSYIWDGQGENPYFGLLALARAIVVTSDSVCMISEACSTGKPVYIYELPGLGKRHQQFCNSFIKSGRARLFTGSVEEWNCPPLEDTRKAAEFVVQRYTAKLNRCEDRNGVFFRF
jgi:mitochondrial fission protein ELM1